MGSYLLQGLGLSVSQELTPAVKVNLVSVKIFEEDDNVINFCKKDLLVFFSRKRKRENFFVYSKFKKHFKRAHHKRRQYHTNSKGTRRD